MRCGIPLLEKRVAPRCAAADEMLVVTVWRGHVTAHHLVSVQAGNALEMVRLLKSYHIDTLVCGGIGRDLRETLRADGVSIMDNVVCSSDEILEAIEKGALRSGFGLRAAPGLSEKAHGVLGDPGAADGEAPQGIDCLRCTNKVCLQGESCFPGLPDPSVPPGRKAHPMLEAAADISQEKERRLCRLAELVYFCLEMRYSRIGIAFCIDLAEPAQILADVLRRFFDVVPVCCKIGGLPEDELTAGVAGEAAVDTSHAIACNPLGQAQMLNRSGSELNVLVGLCMGVDCLFAQASRAPVTTLFVKDKSLANNPIGAVYSEYHIRESLIPPSVFPRARAAPVHGQREES